MEQFGQYRLEQLIGRGGMGEVFRAYDTVRDRVVALKRLPAHLASDATFQARFRRESALASRLSEPHIIPIHDFGEIDGRLFLDMRLVTGRDLGEILAESGPLAPDRAVAIVAQVAGALDAAHADGLVHRDIKPSNVLVTGSPGREFVYLLDFGIARALDASGETPLTSTGMTVGTVDYMAPERFLGGGTDHRADVYSLTCVLFETLTGRKPFRGDGLPAMIHAHLHREPPCPAREHPGVPRAFDAVVARGMAKKPEDRYPSAGALADAALAALADAGSADDPTRPFDGPPPVPPDATVRLPQPAGGPSRTVLELPDAGFTPPEPAAPPPSPARRRGRYAAVAAAAAVAAIAVVVVVLLLPSRNDPTSLDGSQTTTETTTDTTATVATNTRPESLAGGDAEADQELWDSVRGSGAVDGGCSYVTPTASTARSSLECAAVDPELDRPVRFDAHRSAAEAQTAVADIASRLTGNRGSCEAGGTFLGEQSSRYMACGIVPPTDAGAAGLYVIRWSDPDLPYAITIVDDDPANAWAWFSAHDSL